MAASELPFAILDYHEQPGRYIRLNIETKDGVRTTLYFNDNGSLTIRPSSKHHSNYNTLRGEYTIYRAKARHPK